MIFVDEMNPFLVTYLELQNAYQVHDRPGLYFEGFEFERPTSPLMPWNWWWTPAGGQGTYVLTLMPWPWATVVQDGCEAAACQDASRPGS